MRQHWTLEEGIAFLNHGSFGATPRVVIEHQRELQARLERQPVRFMLREAPDLWYAALDTVAAFLRAPADELAFVRNASEGANAVLRSIALEPGDEIVVSDHGYPAILYAARYVAERAGAHVVVAEVPFPITGPDEVVEAFEAAVSPRTRLVVADHVTSPTGLVFPVERVVRAMDARGIDVLVDGAHAPVMVDLDVSAVGAAYYTGNFHKWACAPKGAGFLHVRADRRAGVVPTVVSHGYRPELCDRDRFRATFDWTGTMDPTAVLSVPVALDFLAGLEGGLDRLRRRNRELCLEGRVRVAEALGVALPAPDAMIGFLGSLRLPPGAGPPPSSGLETGALQRTLWEEHRIEVPIFPFPRWPERLLRISAFAHNGARDYRRLAEALPAALRAERTG